VGYSPIAAFVVPLAQPKERHRAGNGRTYTPAKTAAAEKAIGLKFLEAARGHEVDAKGRYRLRIAVRGANPLSDLDNHAKTVMDALNGICWAGDNQVDELLVRRFPGSEKQTIVAIYRIEEG
jgi:Holliday junction resolvase RusA-like endonuclease